MDDWRYYLSDNLIEPDPMGGEVSVPRISREPGVQVVELCGDISAFAWGVLAHVAVHDVLAAKYEVLDLDGD